MQNFIALLGILVGLSLTFSGCNRAAPASSGTVVFSMPAASSLNSKVNAMSEGEPADLSDINCFYVVAAGPEDILSNTTCGRVNPDKSLEFVLKGGPIVGGARAGENLEVTLPAGSNRQFYLLGMKRPLDSDCKDISDSVNFEPVTTTTIPTRSNIYVLGQSAKVDVLSNSSTVIEIPMTFNEEKWLNACRRVPVGVVAPDPAAAANRLFVNKGAAPFFNTFKESSCQPVHFDFRNESGVSGPATLDTNVTVSIGDGSGNFTIVPTYVSMNDCGTSNSPTNTFLIEQGDSSATRWIFTPTRTAGEALPLKVTTDNGDVKVSHFLKVAEAHAPIRLRSASPSVVTFDLQGPRLIGTSNQCVPYVVSTRSADSEHQSMGTYTFSGYGTAADPFFKVYSDINCTSNNEITATTGYSGGKIFVKFLKSPDSGFINLGINPVSATGPAATLLQVQYAPTTNLTNAHVKLMTAPIVKKDVCTPVFASLQNSYGATVPATANYTVTVSPVTSLLVYLNSTCSSSGTITFSWFPTSIETQVFYIKFIGTAPASGAISHTETGGVTVISPNILFETGF